MPYLRLKGDLNAAVRLFKIEEFLLKCKMYGWRNVSFAFLVPLGLLFIRHRGTKDSKGLIN